MTDAYYILGAKPQTVRADRTPRLATRPEWHDQQRDAALGLQDLTVGRQTVTTADHVWTVTGTFIGVATAVEPRTFRVEVRRESICDAQSRQVACVAAATWDDAAAMVEVFATVAMQAVRSGNTTIPLDLFTNSAPDAAPASPPRKPQVAVTDYQKVIARVKRLVALAGRSLNPNEAERRLAAQKTAEYLAAHPTPLRWLVKPGTTVRIVETKHMAAGLGRAKTHLKTTKARGQNWFFEAQRVQGPQAVEALRAGWLQFERHGYTVFVPAGDVEVHL